MHLHPRQHLASCSFNWILDWCTLSNEEKSTEPPKLTNEELILWLWVGEYLQPIQLQLVASLETFPSFPAIGTLNQTLHLKWKGTRDRSAAVGHFKTQRMGKIQAQPVC